MPAKRRGYLHFGSYFELHFDVRYAVLQKLLRCLPKAHALVELPRVCLRLDGEPVCAEFLFRDLYALAHQLAAQPAPPLHRDNAPQRRRRESCPLRQHAQVSVERAVLAAVKNVVSAAVVAVDLGVRALLLHHKNVHPQPQYIVKLFISKLAEMFYCKSHVCSLIYFSYMSSLKKSESIRLTL